MPQQAAPPATTTLPPRRAPLPWRSDLWWVLAATLACYLIASKHELREAFFQWVAPYERWQIDELPFTVSVLASGLAWYAWRRQREALAELQMRVQAQAHAHADALPHAATRGLGLLGATERAAALGGPLTLRSAPGAGVQLRLCLPLRPTPEATA